VLVVGGEGDKRRYIAESYGFKDVVIPGDIIKDYAAQWVGLGGFWLFYHPTQFGVGNLCLSPRWVGLYYGLPIGEPILTRVFVS